MSTRFQCVKGHLWLTDGGATQHDIDAPRCPTCGGAGTTLDALAATDAEIKPPDLTTPPPVIDEYDLLEVIGKGGMGIVYRAFHRPLSRDVALKVVLAAEHAQPAELERFSHEASIAAPLRHPNIVSIYHVGLASGRPYFTMELIDGGNLRHLLKKGSMNDRAAAELLSKLARAVQHAHEQGIVHRDLKPENVLLTNDGEPKITDFGVAKRLSGGQGLTKTGAVLGTPDYMSPEQARGKREVGPLADVYALGIILYECLTGRAPFQSDSVFETLQKVLTEDPVSPAWFRPGISRDIETICLKCLRKRPEDRYESAAALADDLERFLSHRTITARRTSAMGRAAKWSRRHPIFATLLFALLAMIGGGLSWRIWNYYKYEHVSIAYFSDFLKKNRSYEGVVPLTLEQVRNRPASYKFYTRGGQLFRMDVVDWRGELTGNFAMMYYLDPFDGDGRQERRDCTFEMIRDKNGQVIEEVTYDRNHRDLVHFRYTSPTTAEYRTEKGYPMSWVPSGATFVEIIADAQGRDSIIHFLDREQHSRPNIEGAYGWKLEYDERGLLNRFTYLDQNDKPFRAGKGYTSKAFERDRLGRVVLSRFLDEHGRPTRHKDGYSSIRHVLDAYGRIIEEQSLDEDSKPVVNRLDYAIAKIDYRGPDDYTFAFFDEHERPHPQSGTRVRMSHKVTRIDERGRTVRETSLGPDGKPVRLHTWQAAEETTYDTLDRPTKIDYIGPDDKLTFTSSGYARETYVYDRDGNMIEWRCFDTEDRPVRCKQWFARMQCGYDVRGRRTSEAYFDTEDNPTLCNDGFALKKMAYDIDGKLISEEYYDAQSKPTRCTNRFHRMELSYDASGYLAEERFFGPSGLPTWHKEGYAVLRFTNDARGNHLEREALADDRHAILDWSRNSIVQYEYDPWGNVTREKHLGPERAPLPALNKAVIIERTYDRLGQELSEAYFDAEHTPIACSDGYWQTKVEYGPGARQSRVSFLDTEGNLCESTGGVAMLEFTPDARTNPAVTSRYNAKHELISKPGQIAIFRRTYDDRDLRIDEEYFDAHNKPMAGTFGYWRMQTVYDDRGLVRELRYLDADGKPAKHTSGNSLVRRDYDDRGLMIEESYFDEHGDKLELTDGNHKVRLLYDARGNVLDRATIGTDDALKNGPAGFARTVAEYDDRDHKSLQRYFAADGSPCPHREGNYIVVWRYNDCDQESELAFLDDKKNPVLVPEYGYARRLRRYDNHGNQEVDEFRDARNNLVVGKPGYARLIRDYDELNRFTRRIAEDAAGKRISRPVITKVVEGELGERLGLKVGDAVLQYDGRDVDCTYDFIQTRKREPHDDARRPLRIERAGETIELPIPPGTLYVELDDRLPEKAGTPTEIESDSETDEDNE